MKKTNQKYDLRKMKISFRKYQPERDFLRVRDLLIKHYSVAEKPFNWGIARWNYARYFVAPLLGAWGVSDIREAVPDPTGNKSREAIWQWENSIGIWENDTGDIIGVVNPETYVSWRSDRGLVFFQRHPSYGALVEEMLVYAEMTFTLKGKVQIFIPEPDEPLQSFASNRGYIKDAKPDGYYLEYDLRELPESDLPEGYAILSMADDNDLEKRRKVLGLSFQHPDPNDWPTLFSYQELQRAPDYRKGLDLVVTNASGEYLACCIVWYDEHNRIAHLEPVGSIRLGMGRQVVLEGLRRAVKMGAEKAVMDSDLRFYEKIGFKRKYPSGYIWIKGE